MESLATRDGKYEFTVSFMCVQLLVSRSGFYEWRGRGKSATAQRRADISAVVELSFAESEETYGYRRVHAELVRWGVDCSSELVRSIMRELDLVPCQPRPWRHSLTSADACAGPIPDLVNRDFTAEVPGAKMVGDITYIPTWEGWLFLATVIDCHTKAVIGWAMDDNYKTPLIAAAITMAAQNCALPADAIFHSDRGSNYTSQEFAERLRGLQIRQSVGRTGICYDNAMAESFNAALKVERVHRTAYPTRKRARTDIAEYIESRYNAKRLPLRVGIPDSARSPRRVPGPTVSCLNSH
ncbi:MAG: putative transposase [Solirubrobacterales bacterium]|jgi:transposase InsO family protein|nr:putative transposase [Solirubrobacterales bacterium]